MYLGGHTSLHVIMCVPSTLVQVHFVSESKFKFVLIRYNITNVFSSSNVPIPNPLFD